MKPQLVRSVLGLAGTFLIGLSLPLYAQEPETPSATIISPATPELLEIQSTGERAIDRLTISMVNEVKSTLNGCTPEEAVDMCHLKALPTVNPIRSMPRITAVKFTSLKIRQSDNSPDAADRLALDYIDKILKAGDTPPNVLLQKVEVPDSSPLYRVYKPIGLTSNCLICHGDPADQSPKLRAKLKAMYPDDQALNYRVHDWRGVVRVTVASEIPTP